MDTAEVVMAFDEEWYLRAYPDVASAIRNGSELSAYEHFLRHGIEEGRMPGPQFDAEWYGKSYPAAREEAGSEEPIALRTHYETIGRFRGYLPERMARRASNAPEIRSKFGGLWIDLANAPDLIEGKYEIGQIDGGDKARLEQFIRDGYLILPQCVSPVVLDRADEALERAYSGGYSDLVFECHAISPVDTPWMPGVRDNPAKALDIHWWSQEIRDAIFCDPIVRFLQLIFERPVMASQTLGFYRGSAQPLHQDSAYVAYTLPLQFAASWIALEDVKEGAGELEYLVGSHKALPEFTYPGEMKSVSEARRFGADLESVRREVGKHEQGIQAGGREQQLKREKFRAKRGDVLIWHADLAHGGSPISHKNSRKSIVTHYCPKEVAPLFFEGGRAKSVRKHQRASYYTSGVYE